MIEMYRWHGFILGASLLGIAAGVQADDVPTPPALVVPVAVTATTIEVSGTATATAYTDADRLAHVEAELVALKRAQVVEKIKPKWWEFGCMGCISIVTVLMLIGAIAL